MYTDLITEAILEGREEVTILVDSVDEAATELREAFLLKSLKSTDHFYSKDQFESFEVHSHRKLLIVHFMSMKLMTTLKKYKNALNYVIDKNKKQESMFLAREVGL